MDDPTTKSELIEYYSDTNWRTKLLRLLDLSTILTNCVLNKGYKIPPSLTGSLAFTEFGESVRDYLITKQKVQAVEAKLLCFLTMLHRAPLIDVEKTNINQLETAIHEQIGKRQILLPFTSGRVLYNIAADKFPEEPRVLRYEETLDLLRDSPIGVHQSGYYTTGPFGLIRADHRRHLDPDLQIPLYHCAEVTCQAVHLTHLSTDHSADINVERPKIHTYLERQGKPAEWGSFLREIEDAQLHLFEDLAPPILLRTISDVLSHEELIVLMVELMTHYRDFKERLTPFSLGTNPQHAFESLTHADLLQILLQATDKDIIHALDHLIAEGEITIPRGEIRVPVVSETYGWGPFHLDYQLTHSGVSIRSQGTNIAPLRLSRLLDSLYPTTDPDRRKELDWLIRGVDGTNSEAKLEEFFKNTSSVDAITRLVLSSRRSVDVACEQLNISASWFDSDHDLVDALLCKLGFDITRPSGANTAFWDDYESLANATSTLEVSVTSDDRMIRDRLGSFFRELEGVLTSGLYFTTWALTNDHIGSARPFSYRYDLAQECSQAFLAEAEVLKNGTTGDSKYRGKLTLEPLIQGFALLAESLENVGAAPQKSLRPQSDYPPFDGNTALRSFPFRHRIPYLDLTPESRIQILSTLREISKNLAKGLVAKVRNDTVHFRRTGSDIGEIRGALQACRDAVRQLERGGFTPTEFTLERSVGFENGRTLYFMVDDKGRQIAFSRPTKFANLGLPPFSRPQYLFSAAMFGYPNEMLRFAPSYDSDYSRLWENFPVRRRANQNPSRLVETEAAPRVPAS